MQEHIFCDLFSSVCDSIKNDLKKQKKKTKDVNAKHISQSFETNTNVLKPSVSLPRLL